MSLTTEEQAEYDRLTKKVQISNLEQRLVEAQAEFAALQALNTIGDFATLLDIFEEFRDTEEELPEPQKGMMDAAINLNTLMFEQLSQKYNSIESHIAALENELSVLKTEG